MRNVFSRAIVLLIGEPHVSLRDIESKLDTLDLTEMAQLQFLLEKKVKERQSQERKALIETMEKMAKERGFGSLDALFGNSEPEGKKKQRASVPPKYRNPENPEETWTGRGRQPKWVVAAIAAGAKLEDLLIEKPEEAAEESE